MQEGDNIMARRQRSLMAQLVGAAFGRLGGLTALLVLLLSGMALSGSSAAALTASPLSQAACAPPTVSVTASPQMATAGQIVTFAYSAVPGSGCTNSPLPNTLISYGDGSAPLPLNAPSGSVTHSYSAPGSYTVTVTANSAGQIGQAQTTVMVAGASQPPTVTASAASSVPVGQPVSISYSATTAFGIGFLSIRSMSISFGDGTSPLPLTPPSGTIAHTYTMPGSYLITVIATDSTGRTGQAQTTIVVTGAAQPPSVTLSASPQSTSVGQNVNFTGVVTSATPGAVSRSAVIAFGDGQNATPQATGAGLIAQHAYNSPGTYTATLSVTDSNGQTGQAQATVNVTAPAQPPSVSLSASPQSAQAGANVNFTGVVTSAAPGALTAGSSIAYGDGQSDTPQATGAGLIAQHVYNSPGTYTATLTVTDSNGQTGQASTQVIVSAAPVPGVSITYPAGWNLIGVPPNTTLPAAQSSLYTYQAGDTAYQVAQSPQPGTGYWIYFAAPATVTLPFTGPQVITRTLPAGQFVMVGNPGSAAAILSGADVAYTYDSATGYQPTNQIPPGQGAWVLSNAGGTLTITSGPR